MSKKINNRVLILLGALLVLVSMQFVIYFQNRKMENQLLSIAQYKVANLRDGRSGDSLEIARPVITVSREFVLFGKPKAKISLYMRTSEGGNTVEKRIDDSHFAHGHTGEISGLDYFMDMKNDKWVETESSMCSSEQCQTEGKKAFDN